MRRALPVGLAALATLTATGAQAAPQTFNTALPVAQGEFVARQQVFYKNRSKDPSPANRDVDVFGSVSVVGYGVTADFSLFGVLPVVDKTLRATTPAGVRVKRTTSGLADARLFARYIAYTNNAPGRTVRIAPFAGVELPTGDNKDSDGLGRLPATFQRGSGSFDPFFGVVTTYQTLDYEVDAQVSYKVNTRADGFEFGDEFHADASLQYRIWPPRLEGGTPAFVYAVGEVNFAYKEKNRIAGAANPNSGGITVMLAPGIQYVTQRLIAEAIVQIPVVRDVNGTALADSITVRAGVRFNF